MNPGRRLRIAPALFLAVLIGSGVPGNRAGGYAASPLGQTANPAELLTEDLSCGAITGNGAPEKAWNVLEKVDSRRSGASPDPYFTLKNAPFKNDGRSNTTLLPKNSAEISAIVYREYDVNPAAAGQDRGRERLVVGSNGSAYFTNDHYCNWVQMR